MAASQVAILSEASCVKSIPSSDLGHSLPNQEDLDAHNVGASQVAILGDLTDSEISCVASSGISLNN
jgi:hypothetical protein